MQAAPQAVGITLANWNWKVVQLFVQEHFGQLLSRSSCFGYLHRLGFVVKRPKRRLLKAEAAKWEASVAFYAALRGEAQATEADGIGVHSAIIFVDEAHFRADVELRSKWVLRGEPAFADSTSPRLGEKAIYYSGVCLEAGTVDTMTVSETCTAATSVAFLQQLRARYSGPLIVIWDNSPTHRGPEIREYLATAGLALRLVALPAYSPDFNPAEAIWDWAREEVTANTCFGTAASVREHMARFFVGLAERTAEVQRRCRRELQAQADALAAAANEVLAQTDHVVLTLDSV